MTSELEHYSHLQLPHATVMLGQGRRWNFLAGGSKVRESGGRNSPSGVQGRSPARRPGGLSPTEDEAR